MKKLLTIALHRILILFGCLLTAMACSSGDDSIADPADTDKVVKMDSVPETAVVDSMPLPQEVDSLPGEVVLDSMPQPQEIDSLPAGGVVDSLRSIVGLIESSELSLFSAALSKTDLTETLNGEGPFTVFAPTDAAVQQLFVALGDDYNSFNDFKNPIELQILKDILSGHVVAGKIASKDFEGGKLPTLLPEDSIELVAQEDTFVIKDASEMFTNFVAFDLEASNGTVHTIDQILIPQKVLAFVE